MSEQSFFCIRPYAFPEREAIKRVIRAYGLTLRETKIGWFSPSDIDALYGHEKPSIYFDACCEFMTNGLVEFGIVEGDQAISVLKTLAGMSHIPAENSPDTLRAQFGKAVPIEFRGVPYYFNPIHRSSDHIEAARDIALFRRLETISTAEMISRMMLHLHEVKNLACVFHHHITEVVSIGRVLTEKYGGNRDVIELACWMHDVSTLKIGNKLNHHIEGAREAGEILSIFSCDVDTIRSVQHCIRSHRGPLEEEPMSLDAEIVCAADGLANLSQPSLLYLFAFGVKKLSFEVGIESIRKKVARSYCKIPDFLKDEALEYLSLWKRLGVL
jgi:nucleoside diphosphate kinase